VNNVINRSSFSLLRVIAFRGVSFIYCKLTHITRWCSETLMDVWTMPASTYDMVEMGVSRFWTHNTAQWSIFCDFLTDYISDRLTIYNLTSSLQYSTVAGNNLHYLHSCVSLLNMHLIVHDMGPTKFVITKAWRGSRNLRSFRLIDRFPCNAVCCEVQALDQNNYFFILLQICFDFVIIVMSLRGI